MRDGSSRFFREGNLKMGFGGEPLRQVGGGRAVQGMDPSWASVPLPLSAAGYNVTVATCKLKHHRQGLFLLCHL